MTRRDGLKIAADYTKREAFGQRIGSFQHNKFLLAEMTTKLDVAQAYIDAAVICALRRTAVGGRRSERLGKWWSSEIQNDVLDGVQLHGGCGYM